MVFLHSSSFSRWYMLHTKSTKMTDFQLNLETWLQDASLFRNEPVDYAINFDDFLTNEKANTEEDQPILSQQDMGWFDEKLDLSVFDNPGALLDHQNDTEKLMDDDTAILLGLIDGGLDSSYLSSDPLKVNININVCLNSENLIEPISSEVLDSHLGSPCCAALQVDSPAFLPAQSPASPFSDVSEALESSVNPKTSNDPYFDVIDVSPQLVVSSVSSDAAYASDSSVVHVSVYEDVTSPASSSDEVMNIEEVSRSVRKRKFVADGDYIPKVKVILKDLPQSSNKNAAKPKDRKERKKLQNKEAAARYRIKKRVEDKELSDEISNLESTQKELKDKHNSLQSEIKYLKNLMCEILQKKGIFK